MSERIGYSLPPGSARPMYMLTFVGTVLGLVFPYWHEVAKLFGAPIPIYLTGQPHYSAFSITGYLLVVIFLIGTTWYHARKNWVFILPRGIEGKNRRGVKSFIAWSEPIAISKSSDLGIKCLVVSSEKNGCKILLPISIADSVEFQTMLGKVAPTTHELNRFLAEAL